MVAITGMPGIGKTGLALVLAHQLARTEYRDDQLFVSLDRQQPITPSTALHDRLLTLGVPRNAIPADLAGRRRQYLDELQDGRALVVLDDATDPELVRALWPEPPRGSQPAEARPAPPPRLEPPERQPAPPTRRLGELTLTEQLPEPPQARRYRVLSGLGQLWDRLFDHWMPRWGSPHPRPASRSPRPPVGHIAVGGTLQGHGFGARERVDVFADGGKAGTEKTSGDGSFTAPVWLGWHRPGAVVLVQAVGRRSRAMAFRTVTIPDV